ncbi:MAG: YceI family protein [Maribacter sp.]|nr:YceI family protein [Maribacter sp.]
MKGICLLTLGLLFIVGSSCKEVKKDEEGQRKEIVSENYTLVKDSTKVSFTAYKTTEKLAVGGKFLKIDFKDIKSGATALGALNGTSFGIPVSSLFTNDATGTRDPKLLEFFFGAMKNTELISGVFKKDANNKCSIDITMNGETANIPLEYTMDSVNIITFNGNLNLEDWNALEALASINKACKELHTGTDGISKTWSDVAVQAQVQFLKK